MGDTFDFSHALKLLRQGHRLTRVSGHTPWFEIWLDQSDPDLPILLEKTCEGHYYPWIVTASDVLACDWMVVSDGE